MIERFLKRQGYSLPGKAMRNLQEKWLQWYRGSVPEVHRYSVYNGQKRQTAERYRLGMAKVVCEDFASLLLNEHVQISCQGFDGLARVLEENRFYTRMNRLAELTMALGTGAVAAFLGGDGKPVIDFIGAGMIYPLSWDGDSVDECAFASKKMVRIQNRLQKCSYVQMHVRAPGGWQIRNVWLDDRGNVLPVPDGLVELSPVSPVPLFQLVRPNAINAADFDSPFGASVFADALDQLAACDIVFDSLVNEFVLGKKRLMIPASLSTLMVRNDAEGREQLGPLFDPNDALMYVYQVEPGESQKPFEVDLNLRIEQHNAGLQRSIDMLSKKCGLGIGRYRFEESGVRTATEVISAKSDLYQSLKRHEKPFGDAIIGLVRALAWLSGQNPQLDVTVKFDDSIIEDESATLDRCIRRVNNRLMSRQAAIMEVDGVDEKEAEKRLARIIAEERMEQAGVERAMYEADTGGDL